MMKILVPYRGMRTIQELLAGYDWYNPGVTDENFPFERHDDVEVPVEFIPFGKAIDEGTGTKEIIATLTEKGLRGLNAAESLALGKIKREQPINGFGQTSKEGYIVCAVNGRAIMTTFTGRWSSGIEIPATPI
ncbi:hypothetical protein A3A39_00560 [Candidatus Kaiserbacteria bacterium RIFCSPLOWO2_01_FULL_54_13]|uniref:Uncharacterized protein n=1 Tax=Candidatus Kaiserbacteria bacterium RIFCSPLOWO2_01_FULL_54_13 TaxID=1798512 RepID=A0A1F6F0L7_9BACT|nr:MAG: hypothetical protein A3A39_00560 [Candidatus Kaiserbacteria bacterium RIFCSPLOWO2_01_FULL_54_13]